MRDNVLILHRQRGKIVESRQGHNVLVDEGREWLASLICLTSQGPDVPEEIRRVKYMGFGIGGNLQVDPGADIAPLSVSYPAGSDPNITTGKEHDDDFPTKALGTVGGIIETLERPVRITGGSTTYPGAGGDRWLSDPATHNFIMTHPTVTSTRFHTWFDASAGDFIYGSFTSMPLSEAGLFLSDASDTGSPFETLIAYHSFVPIILSSVSELEVIWDVNF